MSRIAIGAIGGHLVVVLFPGAMQHSRLGTLSSGTWFGVFDRWDAGYYTTIAAHGYPNAPAPLRVFFPGYPLVVRVAHDLTGGALTYNQAGCIVSWSAMVAASILLYGLVDRRFGSRAALVSVVLFCWFPTSCFLLAPYSEALFILEILIVVTLVERGAWWLAALVGGFASATFPEGVVLAIAIAIAALIGCRGLWRTVGYGLASIWGLAAYTVFLGVRFGDPLAYVTEEGNWHRLTRFPFTGIVHNIGSIRHVMDERGPVPAGYRFVRPNIVWAWIVNDAMVVVAAAALVYLVVITVRVRRADTGPASRSAGSHPLDRDPGRGGGDRVGDLHPVCRHPHVDRRRCPVDQCGLPPLPGAVSDDPPMAGCGCHPDDRLDRRRAVRPGHVQPRVLGGLRCPEARHTQGSASSVEQVLYWDFWRLSGRTAGPGVVDRNSLKEIRYGQAGNRRSGPHSDRKAQRMAFRVPCGRTAGQCPG
jgi:hypothetical protein